MTAVQRGDRVVIPFVIACGECFFCQRDLFASCDAFDKGLTFKMGQTQVQRYLPELLGHIETGRLQPEAISAL